jgi:LysR family transcriptional regulator for metE and metH
MILFHEYMNPIHGLSMAILDRTHLTMILAIQEHGSLTAAADALHITQSALSHALRKLEDQLGVSVFRRESRKLFLTQAGEYLLGVAKRIEPQLAFAEDRLRQFARGDRGNLRIGMECHPCYQWLIKLVGPYLESWPDVDVDVKQKFQFGGMGALFGYEIDMLVTPDPLYKEELHFEPVFDYEQVLVVSNKHRLATVEYVNPEALSDEALITYPVAKERLDIFSLFLMPAGIAPKSHKLIETTDVMLQMVASGRGVTALPRWLVEECAEKLNIVPVRLGKKGVPKQIFVGVRKDDLEIRYLKDFIEFAKARERQD